MKGLGELQIELVVFGPAWEKMPEAEVVAILEPLRAVTTPKHFELVLPFPISSSEPHFGPYRVKSVGRMAPSHFNIRELEGK